MREEIRRAVADEFRRHGMVVSYGQAPYPHASPFVAGAFQQGAPGLVRTQFAPASTTVAESILNASSFQHVAAGVGHTTAESIMPLNASVLTTFDPQLSAGQWRVSAHLLFTGVAGDVAGLEVDLEAVGAGPSWYAANGPVSSLLDVQQKQPLPWGPLVMASRFGNFDKSAGMWLTIMGEATIAAATQLLIRVYNASAANPLTVSNGSFVECVKIS